MSIRIPSPESGKEGAYDDECEALLHQLHATGVVLIVVGGTKGHGFSVTIRNAGLIKPLAAVLREVADKMERGQLP
jgi:hypothetical protein